MLQSMEPGGVGARDLSECLRIQLAQLGQSGGLADEICRRMLEHLAKNHIHHIAKALNVSEQEVSEAKRLISSLEPTPSNGYDSGECTLWVIPDIEVSFEDGKPQLLYTDGYMPSYGLSAYYSAMLDRPELSEEERDYLREKLSQAQWALGCVKRRRDTLLSCASVIVEEQREFFEKGSGRPAALLHGRGRIPRWRTSLHSLARGKGQVHLLPLGRVPDVVFLREGGLRGDAGRHTPRDSFHHLRRGPETAAERQRNMPGAGLPRLRHRPPDRCEIPRPRQHPAGHRQKAKVFDKGVNTS